MPGELHAFFRSLHHPLFIEQEYRIAKKRGRDVAHQFAENETGHTLAVPVAVGDEVAFASVRDTHHVRPA